MSDPSSHHPASSVWSAGRGGAGGGQQRPTSPILSQNLSSYPRHMARPHNLNYVLLSIVNSHCQPVLTVSSPVSRTFMVSLLLSLIV